MSASAVRAPEARAPEPVAAARSQPPSEYAAQMPRLHEYAALAEADPRRADLREQLILTFLPVVEHLARRHANSGDRRRP